jgi:hypothetical protein
VSLRLAGAPSAVTRPGVEFAGAKSAAPAPKESHYRFFLRFGPRSYKDYIKATKALDAGPIRVSGRLLRDDGRVLAWCSGYVSMLETPNNITKPALYFPTLKRMEFSRMPVNCVGPPERNPSRNPSVSLHWSAEVTLRGDREVHRTIFRGSHTGLTIRREETI